MAAGTNWLRIAAIGAPVYIAATVGTYMFMKAPSGGSSDANGVDDLPVDPHVHGGACTCHAVYDDTAAVYDSAIGMDEATMGLGFLRRWLISQATGRVLEVAAGTGRNVSYYPRGSVSHVQLSDRSRAMLGEAKGKAAAEWGSAAYRTSLPAATASEGGGVTWGLTPAASEALPFPDGTFDTTVSTFSLCSVDDPHAAVRDMARVTAQGGRLLFLEHGRSPTWPFMNRWLDSSAPAHASKWGCWWNRDLLQVMAKAEEAGLVQVTKQWTTHFGTTLWVEATPCPPPHTPAQR